MRDSGRGTWTGPQSGIIAWDMVYDFKASAVHVFQVAEPGTASLVALGLATFGVGGTAFRRRRVEGHLPPSGPARARRSAKSCRMPD